MVWLMFSIDYNAGLMINNCIVTGNALLNVFKITACLNDLYGTVS